ncbi:YT521-B-like domain-containing protein [Ampelomyces quisqualis]|uniref:YT521-B-like domain-containing protein n=1 Tax=Ampelomyces quisqualis TaxID=50730 RepID=A0A6A5QHL6_AMPQU|nr:YT521-B-like domain-containing protein [Ampelomyces quisqualis]
MAFFWVQQWVALPVIYEGPMGEIPPHPRPQALDSSAVTGFARDGTTNLPASNVSPYKITDNSTPLYSQLSAPSQNHLRPDHRSPAHATPQPSSQEHGTSPLNMGPMAGALPVYGTIDNASATAHAPQSIPRSLPGAPASAVAYQLGQTFQMPGQAPGNISSHHQYGSAYAAGLYQQQAYLQGTQQSYSQFVGNRSRMPATELQTGYQHFPGPSQYMYYSAPYGHQPQYNPGFPAQGQAMYDRRGSIASASPVLNSSYNIDYQHHDASFASARLGVSGMQVEQSTMGSAFSPPFPRVPGTSHSSPISSIPRGPPRKPKQSGHALWVGNLPPGTTVVALKDHFSREATKDIESLFLISKSNCAFVNYRSEVSCTAAMHRFHDSRFNGVRLVCRLRRSSAPASGVPTGPSSMVGSQQSNASPPMTPKLDSEATTIVQEGAPQSSPQNEGDDVPEPTNSSSKYFIVKSLTLQDLELSVRNGIWATQSHNEDVLNKAFQTAENVYLIFSANKSGEYFGYARMTSPILEDNSPLVGSTPKPDNFMDAPDVPKSIPTPATEWAPRGKIIDDSARGTIFWEAELSETEIEEEAPEKEDRQVEGDSPVIAQSWGKPFKIEWLSTNRLPFYRTRGLRNPWNANREVKIARDGTELEPSVGDRLVQMFHRLGAANAGAALPPNMMAPHPLGGPGIPLMRSL